MNFQKLILGGNVFGWTIDEKRSFEVLDAFVGAGFSAVDTADVYSRWKPGNSGGESEAILGKWMKARGNRARVLIATKAGMVVATGKGLSRAHILRAIDDSLRRLQTDYIDLYQAHVDDRETQLEETLETFAELARAGKVRAIGASNYDGARLAQAVAVSRKLGIPTYQTLQPLYNLCDREEFERDLAPVCLREKIAVIPYYTLAAGFLTGKYRTDEDFAKYPRGERVKRYRGDRGTRILAALDQVSREEKTTPARAAVAWLRERPTVAAPISSATSVEQVGDLVAGARLTLRPESIKALDLASRY
jgi:aryl-alcohol dehydrogenase-like predicted oxidoreductase